MATLPERLRAVLRARDPLSRRTALRQLEAALQAEAQVDPLLAASAADLVEDPTLRERLAAAADVPTRVGEARVLVVDADGRGRVAELVVTLGPGRGEVWTPASVARDTELAAQTAAAAALGPALDHLTLRWQLRDAAPIVGPSIGLGLWAAALHARGERPYDQDTALTGAVDLDGRVRAVGSLPAKVRAAAEAGLRRVIVPAAQVPDLVAPAGLTIEGLARAARPVVPSPPAPARRGLRWLWLALPPLAAATGVTVPLDAAVVHPLLDATRPVLPAEHTAILGITEARDLRALRQRWPDVLRGLRDAGAEAVAFDLIFAAADPADLHFAVAANELRAGGVPVVVGARFADGARVPAGTPALDAATRPALVDVEVDTLTGRVRRAPLREGSGDDPTWHLAVEALAALLDTRPVWTTWLRIGVTRNSTDGGSVLLAPVHESPVLSLDDPAGWTVARDRVVLVGMTDPRRDRLRTPGGPRSGVEVHAALVETLAANAALRPTPLRLDVAVAAALGVLTAGLRRLLPRMLAPLSLLPAATVAAALMFWVTIGGTSQVAPALFAVLLGLWVGRR